MFTAWTYRSSRHTVGSRCLDLIPYHPLPGRWGLLSSRPAAAATRAELALQRRAPGSGGCTAVLGAEDAHRKAGRAFRDTCLVVGEWRCDPRQQTWDEPFPPRGSELGARTASALSQTLSFAGGRGRGQTRPPTAQRVTSNCGQCSKREPRGAARESGREDGVERLGRGRRAPSERARGVQTQGGQAPLFSLRPALPPSRPTRERLVPGSSRRHVTQKPQSARQRGWGVQTGASLPGAALQLRRERGRPVCAGGRPSGHSAA